MFASDVTAPAVEQLSTLEKSDVKQTVSEPPPETANLPAYDESGISAHSAQSRRVRGNILSRAGTAAASVRRRVSSDFPLRVRRLLDAAFMTRAHFVPGKTHLLWTTSCVVVYRQCSDLLGNCSGRKNHADLTTAARA
jgi:hypothetical protein